MLSCVFAILTGSRGGNTAQIMVNGVLIDEIDLHGNHLPYTFNVVSETGGKNTIEVEEGRIRIVNATCPDGVCVRQGFISDGTIPIVCLPHRLTIQIITNESDDFDAATG